MLRTGKIFLAIFILCVLPAMSVHAVASRGVALVIGNSAYRHAGELKNPRNDAEDMAAAFAATGFKVVKGVDLDRASMERTIRKFARALKKARTGVFFYAGHALQINGRNYLVPIDAELEDATGVDFELVRLGLVQRTMERSAKTNLIFLDACRNNPLARNLARAMGTRSAALGSGLASVEGGIGTLISFSTQPGNVALDGDGRNSPFAGALAKSILTTDGDISDVLIRVRREVMGKTGRRQIPWEHSALTSKFYFKTPSAATPVAPPSSSSQQPLDLEKRAEFAHWNAVRDAQSPDIIETYLEQYPNGKFAAVARVLIGRLKRLSAGERPSKLASLPTARIPSNPTTATDLTAIAIAQQRELQRVGCYVRKIDGDWGRGSRGAMARFNARAKLSLHTDRPTTEAVGAIKKHLARVCSRPGNSKNRTIAKPKRKRPAKIRTERRQKPTRKKTARTKVCRKETRRECKLRVGCGVGRCPPHIRGTGVCLGARRQQICR